MAAPPADSEPITPTPIVPSDSSPSHMPSQGSTASDFPCAVEEVACDLCGSREHRVLFHARDTLYDIPGTFPVVRCANCRLVYVTPRPTADAIWAYYPSTSYVPHQANRKDDGNPIGNSARRLVFSGKDAGLRTVLTRIHNTLSYRMFLPSPQPGKVLDVGCGTGGYLAQWQRLGWTVEGLEPTPNVAEIARTRLGATIHEGVIETATLPQGHYDVITMCHSLEHTYSPRTALLRAWQALKPGGHILIMVPNFAAWERAAFGASWLALEVPRHLFHFEPSVLRRALVETGFTDVQVGGSAMADGTIRHVRQALGHGRDGAAPFPVRLALTLAMTPSAILQRSKSLWAIARRPG